MEPDRICDLSSKGGMNYPHSNHTGLNNALQVFVLASGASLTP